MPSVKIMFSWLTSYWWTTDSIPLPPPLPTTPVKVVHNRPLPLRSQSTPILITPQEIGVKRRTLRRVSEEEKRKYTPPEQPVFNYTARLRRVPETSKDQYRQSLSVPQVKNIEVAENLVQKEIISSEEARSEVVEEVETSEVVEEVETSEVVEEVETSEVVEEVETSEDDESVKIMNLEKSDTSSSEADESDNIYPITG